ncbi:hypothetical protein ABE501_18415 [Comamonas testosteroni]
MAKALGTDDSITTCDCCGKSNLKFTVTIELDDGELVHYGQVCAQRNTGKDRKTINTEIRTEAQRVRKAAANEYAATPEHKIYMARLQERNSLSWDDPRRIGRAGYEFVREADQAADAARAMIAAKFGLLPHEVHA